MAKQAASTAKQVERALMFGVDSGTNEFGFSARESIQELCDLAATAGLQVCGTDLQKLDQPKTGTYFGAGKVAEWAAMIQGCRANVVVVDDELRPAQQRYLEESWNLKVIDRTMLILDIFARRARTSEAKLQIEMAQLEYLFPRLTRMWQHFGQQSGGIGVRGPGETQLEVDRRRNRLRVAQLKKQLQKVRGSRELYRNRRQAVPVPVVSLVGYTNAGKSTLFNALTQAAVLAEDKLFATLDPTTRHIRLANGQKILLTDTVGFIQKLPHSLISGFHATLEEVTQADLLVHVVDASHPKAPDMVQTVLKVLEDIHAIGLPMVLVANKADCGFPYAWQAFIKKLRIPVCAVSALKASGLERLGATLAEQLRAFRVHGVFCVPADEGATLAELQSCGSLKITRSDETGVWLEGWVDKKVASKYRRWEIVAIPTSSS